VGGSLVALAVAGVLVFVVVRFASEHPDEVNLGPSVFRFRADRLAREVDERGPFLLKDPLNRGRELYVQHLGDDVRAGWSALSAYASRVSVDCLLRWEAQPEQFVDPCTGRRYPASGDGLVTYPTQVEDGVVVVDLDAPRR
jgi:hypothetical protein